MAARTIKYVPKITSARTEYCEIDPEDQAWLIDQLIHWLALMGEMDQATDADSEWVRTQWWHRKTNKLNSGKQGRNTPCSFVSGVILNMLYKQPAQRDLTRKQMDDFETISAILAQVYPVEAIRFQIGF